CRGRGFSSMWDYKLRFEGRRGPGRAPLHAMLSLACVVPACTERTLLLVDPCPSGATAAGVCLTPADAGPSEAGAPSTLSDGLVGHWRFDDGAGTTMALDSSGNGYHGTLVGLDPSTAWTTEGRLAGALETKGQGYASVSNLPRIDAIDTQVSVAAWVYLDGVINDYATAVSKQIQNTVNQYYHLALNSEARPSLFISPRVPGSATVQPLAVEPVPPQTWTHLAGTWDGVTARLYVDGALVSMKNVTGAFGRDPNPLLLGANGNNGMVSERFPGRIDEIVLYNRALGPSEISQLAMGVSF
ncbi:MAG: LamG domain-containing protein, partial [Pseudomonadota bacterium]